MDLKVSKWTDKFIHQDIIDDFKTVENKGTELEQAETLRIAAEDNRVTAETLRETTTDAIKTDYDNATKANLSVEVSNARGVFGTLKARLDGSDSSLANIMHQNKLFKLPNVMAIPPTITLGAVDAASTLTNPILYPSVDSSGVLNPVFNYIGGEYVRKSTNYPGNMCVYNIARTTTNTVGNIIVEFCHYGTSFELREKSYGLTYKIAVDEGNGYEYVTAVAQSGTPSTGTLYLRKVEFAEAKLRKIRVEYHNYYFCGVYINGNDTIFTPKTKKPQAIFVGDSYTEGSNADNFCGCFAGVMAKLLDWDFWNSGVGGSGYINPGTTGRVKFRDRIQHDVISYKPDFCIIAGGINDTGYAPIDVQTEAELLYDTILSGTPKTQIIVIGNWSSQDAIPDALAITDALKAAALSKGLPFIDVLRGTTYDKNGNILTNAVGAWIAGTGDEETPTTSGNSSAFISTDGTHPNKKGHEYLGTRSAIETIKILNN